jgi:hypothetical protein
MNPDPMERELAATKERLQALQERLTQHELVQQREIHMALESTNLARQEMERRLGEMNEFRAQLSQERTNYVNRDLLDSRLKEIGTRIELLEKVWANMQGRLQAGHAAWAVGVLILSLLMRYVWR